MSVRHLVRLTVPFRALFLAILLSVACVQTASNRYHSQLSNEELHRDFPDAQLVWPTDPPRGFDFDTNKWSDWPPAKPDALVVVIPHTPAIPRRIKRR
jgi:hypothetical protein